MEDEKVYLVYTKDTIAHKVYAMSEENAIEKYQDGYEVDSFEVESSIDSVSEEE